VRIVHTYRELAEFLDGQAVDNLNLLQRLLLDSPRGSRVREEAREMYEEAQEMYERLRELDAGDPDEPLPNGPIVLEDFHDDN